MKTNEAIKAYGRTILCTIPLIPLIQKINKNKRSYIADSYGEKISIKNIKNNNTLKKVFNFLRQKNY